MAPLLAAKRLHPGRTDRGQAAPLPHALGNKKLAALDTTLAEQLDIAFPAIPELEAELLLHAVRALVALVVSGPNRRKTQLVEPVCHRGARRLRSIAAAP